MAVLESASSFPESFKIPVIKGIHLFVLTTPVNAWVTLLVPSFKLIAYRPLTTISLSPPAGPMYSQTEVLKMASAFSDPASLKNSIWFTEERRTAPERSSAFKSPVPVP